MAAERFTTLTEQWIRDRLQLKHPCLGDVRSLSLPGSSEQKIVDLGIALNNFIRLKSLDLSHNALTSIEGVQHLKKLERLILYHNLIPSLEEVKVLFGLSALKELDLRLNPLTQSYPRYRPYLLHAMPKLRKLDNCSIRDSERRSSLKKFSSDVCDLKTKPSPFPTGSQRHADQSLGRAACLNTGLSLTDNNDGVLNDEANQQGNSPNSVDRGVQESKGFRTKQHSNRTSVTSLKEADGPKVCFDPHEEKHYFMSAQPRLNGSVKHSRRVARGHFTPNPDQSLHHPSLINVRPPSPRNPDAIVSDPSNQVLHPPRLTHSSVSSTEQSSRRKRGGYRKPLEMLLNLVEQHWTGEQSLHHNNSFLSQAVQILSMMESDISSREAEVKNLKQEVDLLRFQQASREEEHKAEVGHLSAQLDESRQAVGKLNRQLRTVLEENVTLQKQLVELERQALKSMMKDSPSAQIREAQREVEELRKEIEGLRSKVQKAEEVKELSDMLPQVSIGDQ